VAKPDELMQAWSICSYLTPARDVGQFPMPDEDIFTTGRGRWRRAWSADGVKVNETAETSSGAIRGYQKRRAAGRVDVPAEAADEGVRA